MPLEDAGEESVQHILSQALNEAEIPELGAPRDPLGLLAGTTVYRKLEDGHKYAVFHPDPLELQTVKQRLRFTALPHFLIRLMSRTTYQRERGGGHHRNLQNSR